MKYYEILNISSFMYFGYYHKKACFQTLEIHFALLRCLFRFFILAMKNEHHKTSVYIIEYGF